MMVNSMQWMQDLHAARRAFVDRGMIEPNVRPFVWQCWRRCHGYGVDPRHTPRQTPDPERLTQARAANRDLLEASESVLQTAHAALENLPHLLALADRDGIILRLLADNATLRGERVIPNPIEGASWSERDAGCNVVGSALATGEPAVIIGPEHFAEDYLAWTGIGVPLHRRDGSIAGVLALLVPTDEVDARVHIHSWGWALRVAKTIDVALAGTPPSASTLMSLGDIGNPLDGVLGTLELLLRQAGLSSTYERFLQEAERSLNAALDQLQTSHQELQQADAEKDRFLAALSHDLRNPLSAMQNALELTKRMRTSEQRAQAEALIERQADQISRLADNLLEFSRMARGNLVLHKERTDLRECMQSAVQAVQALIAEHRHDLAISLPEAAVWLDADPNRIRQILVNLLSNAVKYTPDGGRIRFTGKQQGGEAVIEVQDSGIGMGPKKLAQLFTPFDQADHFAGNDGSEGLRLGLRVAQRLAEMHGGRIQAQSPGPGRGSLFTLRLPVAAQEAARTPPPGAVQTPSKAQRILLVEDSPDVAESFAALLRMMGHKVQVAPNGDAGLEAARTFRPNVAFLDIGLPGMDGYELAQRLRSEYADTLPLVALTGYGQEEDRQRAREAGFDYHLLKPVRIEELEQVLNTLSAAA